MDENMKPRAAFLGRNRRPGVLIINRSDSMCGDCGLQCDPHELTHETVLGWKPALVRGCGTRWTSVGTHYTGLDPTQTRPDLPRNQPGETKP